MYIQNTSDSELNDIEVLRSLQINAESLKEPIEMSDLIDYYIETRSNGTDRLFDVPEPLKKELLSGSDEEITKESYEAIKSPVILNVISKSTESEVISID